MFTGKPVIVLSLQLLAIIWNLKQAYVHRNVLFFQNRKKIIKMHIKYIKQVKLDLTLF